AVHLAAAVRPHSADAGPQSGPRRVAKGRNHFRRRKASRRNQPMLSHIARAFMPVSFAAILTFSAAFADPAEPDIKRFAKPVVEVAFVLDTTGSMGPLIEGAKRKIWSIATAIIDENPTAEIRMGLVAYRDIGDEYVTKTFNLTTDIQDLYANLLELKARGG